MAHIFGALWICSLGVMAGPLALFSAPGRAWPRVPCRTFVGNLPAKMSSAGMMVSTGNELEFWNDTTCHHNGPVARLGNTAARHERILVVAFLHGGIFAEVVKPWDGAADPTSQLRLYDAHRLGSMDKPLSVVHLAGEVTGVHRLATGELVLCGSSTWGQEAPSGRVWVLRDAFDADGERLATGRLIFRLPMPVQKLTLTHNLVLGVVGEAGDCQVVFFNASNMASGPFATLQFLDRILDLAVADGWLVLLGQTYLNFFPLATAMKGGIQHSEMQCGVMEDGFPTALVAIPSGFLVGYTVNVISVFKLVHIGCERKNLKTTHPTYFLVALGDAIASSSGLHSVEIWPLQSIVDDTMEKARAFPVDSMGMSLVPLPGQGLAVATFRQVNIFSYAGVESKPRPAFSLPGHASFFKEQEGLFLVDRTGSNSLMDPPVTGDPQLWRRDGGAWQLLANFSVGLESVSAALLLPENLLVLGFYANGLGIYDLSQAHGAPLASQASHGYIGTVGALAWDASGLLLGTEEQVLLLEGPPSSLAQHLTEEWGHTISGGLWTGGAVWDFVQDPWGRWIAADQSGELIFFTVNGGRLELRHRFEVPGPVFSLKILDGYLLVATDINLLYVFAFDPKDVIQELARLPVTAVDPAMPSISVGVVGEDGLLLGLDLYRAHEDSLCAPGHFSPLGSFVCKPCPEGWSSGKGSSSCARPEPATLLASLAPLALLAALGLVWRFVRPWHFQRPGTSGADWSGVFQSWLTPRTRAPQLVFAYAACLAPGLARGAWALAMAAFAAFLIMPRKLSMTSAPYLRAGLALRLLAGSCLLHGCAALCRSHVVAAAAAMAMSCNCLLATQIHLLLATPVVVLDAAVRAANTAGVRVLNMLAVCVCMSICVVVSLTFMQHAGHQVETPIGMCDLSCGWLPVVLLSAAALACTAAVAIAAHACDLFEVETRVPNCPLWAEEEQILPAKIPMMRGRRLLLRISVIMKSWWVKHRLSAILALYDCFTFRAKLKTAASSQRPSFALILLVAAVTASINILANVLAYHKVYLPELGDRNLRLSTFFKCTLLFMKLRVLHVPVEAVTEMDTTWLDQRMT
ncbi:unnamed protein product, partial [Effrenium voratum]